MQGVDPNNCFFKAGFYIEAMKYGPGPNAVEKTSREQITSQIECLLRDANLDLDAREIVDAQMFYAESLSIILGVPPMIALTIFLDGTMHGLAVAGKLEAPNPYPE